MFDSQKSHGIRPAPLILHCRSRLHLFQLCVALTSNFQWCPSQLVNFCAHLSGCNRVKHPKFRVRVRPPRPRCQTWRANTPIASPMALAPQIGMCVSQPRPQWHAQTWKQSKFICYLKQRKCKHVDQCIICKQSQSTRRQHFHILNSATGMTRPSRPEFAQTWKTTQIKLCQPEKPPTSNSVNLTKLKC